MYNVVFYSSVQTAEITRHCCSRCDNNLLPISMGTLPRITPLLTLPPPNLFCLKYGVCHRVAAVPPRVLMVMISTREVQGGAGLKGGFIPDFVASIPVPRTNKIGSEPGPATARVREARRCCPAVTCSRTPATSNGRWAVEALRH